MVSQEELHKAFFGEPLLSPGLLQRLMEKQIISQQLRADPVFFNEYNIFMGSLNEKIITETQFKRKLEDALKESVFRTTYATSAEQQKNEEARQRQLKSLVAAFKSVEKKKSKRLEELEKKVIGIKGK